MTIPSPIPQEQLLSLYTSGKSMMDISKQLQCSVHKVVYWMTKYGIKRRSISQAIYLVENPNGDPFTIKEELSPLEERLYGLGVGIYWGEGEKVSRGLVRVANSDHNLILKFREFLERICQVEKTRIHYSIVCFNDSNVKQVGEYWSKTLGISLEKFGKIVQIPTQGKGTYRKKSTSGVCSITVSSTKLKTWIMDQIAKQRPI